MNLGAGAHAPAPPHYGHDRLARTVFPSPVKGAETDNPNDYEQLGYDASSNLTSRRLRDGQVIAYTFDALNRMPVKDLPGAEADVSYDRDDQGRLLSATQNGAALNFTYDALGRTTGQTSGWGPSRAATTLPAAAPASGIRTVSPSTRTTS